jgi:SNF2 family DNA or RNA helicase
METQWTLPGFAQSEGLRELMLIAEARGAEEWAGFLARQAQRVTAGQGFAIAVDALGELLLRCTRAQRSGWTVEADGDGYRVSDGTSVHAVCFRSADAGSCDCRDYARASLGLCVHLLAVLVRVPVVATTRRPLRWNPVRPFEGEGAWLEGLECDDPREESTLLDRCLDEPRVAEPAVPGLMRAELERQGWCVSNAELDGVLRGMKQPLLPYQRTGVLRFLLAGRLVLADDMGLGKTVQAIGACHALVRSGRVRRALVVVPAALKPQWQREWRQFSDVPIVMVDGTVTERAGLYRGEGVRLIGYEQLLRDEERIAAWGPELGILDEAQRIKNAHTKTAQAVKRLAPAWRLVMTGTPLENRLGELASIVEWVDDMALEPRWRLASWHAIRADGERAIVGAQHLGVIRQRLAPVMLRRVRQDVLAELPARRDTRVDVPLTPMQVSDQRDLDKPIHMLTAIAERRPLTPAEQARLLGLLVEQRLISNGRALRHFESYWPTLVDAAATDELLASLDSPKLGVLRELIHELVVTQGRKVVVFSQWRRMLELAAWAVRGVLAEAGCRAVFFSGQESRQRRTENIVEFHDEPAVRVLFATDAGGVGLNLQRAASACVNLELPWNPAVLEQRIGRIYRLGQAMPIDVYNLVGAEGIEARIGELVTSKRALFTGLLDSDVDVVGFDGAASFMRYAPNGGHGMVRP